ncbi:alpha/beta hydrolase [Hephaestia mangrovi]|uniref:alpha/beta hydrolase n=1 Tax=Hephaestia mangrovi TaxID=2873268 RepID=UPI002107F73D|nr:alpha/beta hydrolase [Hephaestia mangrovi]
MPRSFAAMRSLLASLALAGMALAAPAVAASPPAQELAYGVDPLQRLDYYAAPVSHEPPPLIVFVHGGGWKRGDKGNATGAEKVAHFHAAGYAFASIDYRLVPQATVENQAQDVADALAWLLSRAGKLGFDPDRVVLMGHSAGAHLAALVGTDPRYLRHAGLEETRLKGVVLLDGAAYDVPRQLDIGAPLMHGTYVQAFGTDPVRQRALSPTDQAAAPNAPAFLILHVDRADGIAQSDELAAALEKAGTPVELKGFAGKGLRGHMQINRELGDPSYPATPVVDAWLERVLGR